MAGKEDVNDDSDSDSNSNNADNCYIEDYSNDSERDNVDHDDNECFDDIIMFKESNFTVQSVMTMVMAFSLRFKLSDIGRSEMINMIKLLAGPKFKEINISKYILNKAFDPPDEKIIYHYFCHNCTKTITYSTSRKNFCNKKITCNFCKTILDISLKSTNYFMSIDLSYQLKMLFSCADIKHDIFNYLE